MNEEEIIRIMNMTNGEEVNGYWETREDAKEWINEQDCPEMYMIMEEEFPSI